MVLQTHDSRCVLGACTLHDRRQGKGAPDARGKPSEQLLSVSQQSPLPCPTRCAQVHATIVPASGNEFALSLQPHSEQLWFRLRVHVQPAARGFDTGKQVD